MRRVIRLWADELERLPQYQFTRPTGICHGKTWKRRVQDVVKEGEPVEWLICQYWEVMGTTFTFVHEVELYQGPRWGCEPLRFKIACEGLSGFPTHIRKDGSAVYD